MAPYDAQFGPRVDTACRPFDFTLYFEDIILSIAPNATFLLVATVSSIALLRKQSIVKTSPLLAMKMATLSILFVFQATFLGLRIKNQDLYTNAAMTADVLSLVATTVATALSWLQHQRSEQPCTALILYWTIEIPLEITRIRTIWLIQSTSTAAAVKIVALVMAAAALVQESLSKRHSLRETEKLAHYGPEPFAGLWAIISFSWVLSSLRRGYSNLLSVVYLPGLDYRLSADKLHEKLKSQLRKANLFNKNAFVAACFRAFVRSFLSGVLPRIFLGGCKFAQPFLINQVLHFIGDKSMPQSIGNGLIGAYFLPYAGMATVEARALDLGDIDGMTLMGADVERIASGFRNIHELWASPIEIAIAMYLLEKQILVACVVPGVLVLVCVLIGFGIAKLAKKYQREWIEKVEERLLLITSMLANMRSVKMLGLSQKMFSVIHRARDVEIKTSTRYRYTLIAEGCFSNASIMLAPVVTLIVVVAIADARHDNSFLAAKAFTSLSLIMLVAEPALVFVQTVPSVCNCFGSFDRMQEYCRQPTHAALLPNVPESECIDEKKVPDVASQAPQHKPSCTSENVVKFVGQDLTWNKFSPAVLTSLNASILKGRFTAVVGRTGSGKSTFLESNLGETISLRGCTERRFSSAAYCSQVPWLVSGTIRSNITYGMSGLVDEEWYQLVVSACGLREGVSNMAGGDMMPIGDGGNKLSGGQRQRVSLERAVFSREQVILLDDIFSGLDNANVAHISASLFGPGGILRKSKSTVILVTHSKYLMMMADDVLVIDQGRIVESRTVASLQSDNGFSSGFHIEEATSDSDTEESKEGASIACRSLDRVESVEDQTRPLPEGAEDQKRIYGALSVYHYYIKSCGYIKVSILLISAALYIFCCEFGVVWIDFWSSANAQNPGHANNGMYLGIYAALGVLSSLNLFLLYWATLVDMITASSRNLHTDLLDTVVRAPLRFFQETDSGSITNRFSQDMELIGMELPNLLCFFVACVSECIGRMILLAVFGRYLSATLPILLAVMYVVQRIYLRTSRQIRLLDIEAKAPVYLQFLEPKKGAATLRAFGWQTSCQLALQKLLNHSQRPVYVLYCIQQWLAFVLNSLVTVLVLILVAIVVTWRDKFSPGSVGVSLVTAMSFNLTLISLVKIWTQLETSIGARELGILESQSPPPIWPSAGKIEFKDTTASYKQSGPSVLKSLTLLIRAGEKVAICGRSGSGKTSLILSLLHMIHVKGAIVIDGVDIRSLEPSELRARINVVPQEPFLMPGSVRQNVDPFEEAEDEAIISALERLGLWERIEAGGGIDADMPRTSWSVGERQLLCMARAMVRKSQVLILDEATSSVDHKTEEIIQEVLDTEFAGKTVLSVVHRLGYIERVGFDASSAPELPERGGRPVWVDTANNGELTSVQSSVLATEPPQPRSFVTPSTSFRRPPNSPPRRPLSTPSNAGTGRPQLLPPVAIAGRPVSLRHRPPSPAQQHCRASRLLPLRRQHAVHPQRRGQGHGEAVRPQAVQQDPGRGRGQVIRSLPGPGEMDLHWSAGGRCPGKRPGW
ncbi:hypothetical protein PWT90_09986 [Aphanocladium album]|nr:hypothetical protein PWT90_09986 [Aphanocladium album]